MAVDLPWCLGRFGQVPSARPAPDRTSAGLHALFYEGLPWKGRSTRVFAWLGMPRQRGEAPCPGMVLVHGGGGTAFDFWVRLWNRRGYAAIAMDLCGCLPEPPPTPPGGERERHPDGGPPGWGGFDQIGEPLADQWTYHAVADVLLARSLLAAQPGVDPARVGLTGVSWGGYLTCIAASVEPRFACAVPVYGCGFLGHNSCWKDEVLARMGEERARWLERWDPAVYLRRAAAPMCWVSGTNDLAYPLDSLQKSYRLPVGERTLCIRVEMPHGHGGAGENPEEIRVFADHHLRHGEPLVKITGQGVHQGRMWARYQASRRVVRSELVFTRARGFWSDRKYHVAPAALLGDRVEASIPPLTTACYLNLVDDRECVVSTEHVEPEGTGWSG